VSSQPFAVLSVGSEYKADSSGSPLTVLSGPGPQDVHFSYDAASNTYGITLPGFNSGTLANTGYNGSEGQPATSTTSQLQENSMGFLMPAFVILPVPGSEYSPLTYTSYGYWSGDTNTAPNGEITRTEGIFAYGIPTQAGDVPITGSASYSATIHGDLGPVAGWPIEGSVSLLFDFAAGELSGNMHPRVYDSFDGVFMDFGQYDFTQTVYSSGSTTFSGKFIVPGMPGADSSFDGRFTGPQAAELMARFWAPYTFNGQQGMLSGIWVGEKN
jgi:hypothetical protein